MTRVDVLVDADVLGRARTGDETYVRNLLRELPGSGDRSLRVAASTRHPELVPAGIEAVHLPARSQVVRLGRRLPALARGCARLLHTQYVVPPNVGLPTVVTVHDLSFEHHPEWMPPHDRIAFRALVPRAVRSACHILTVSEFTRDDIVGRYGVNPSRITVTPNGLDPSFGPCGRRPAGDPYLLFVGALQPRKGLPTALAALARLADAPPLVVVGPTRHRGEVRSLVARLGLEGRVRFRGHVSAEELAALYRGAAAFVFPSLFEGFGLPVLEAMASGAPVVTTTAGALPEVTAGAAVLVPPGDPEALAAGIERALAMPDALRSAGFERARSFGWAATAAATRRVYEEVLG